MIVAFKMQQSDDNEISLEDVDEIVINECIASGNSDLIVNKNNNNSSRSACSDENDKKEEEEEVDEGCDDESSPIYVPNDPKTWTEKHIENWTKWLSNQFKIKPPLDPSRFPKSGDELAKFTKADFYVSCASFEGGKSVAQHFKYMIERIGGKCDDTLDTDEVPGKRN